MKFQKAETISVTLEVRNNQGGLMDASGGVTITIYDPAGTKQVDGVAMTWTATGTYIYRYTPATTMLSGEWLASCKATEGTIVNIQTEEFTLED